MRSVHVAGDGSDFMRIMSNVIDNAVEAVSNKKNPSIEIVFRSNSEVTVVYVIDNGIGIPAHIISKVGNKGFSYGKIKGNGLGLSMAKEKISSWGGGLFVTSKEGEGTIVNIKLAVRAKI